MIVQSSEWQELLKWLKMKGSNNSQPMIAKIILMCERGYSRNTIAEKTNYSYSRVCDYIRLFEAGGIEAVRPKLRGRPHKLDLATSLTFKQERFDF